MYECTAKEKRFEELLKGVESPNDPLLLLTLQQVIQEINQEAVHQTLEIVDACFHAYASSYRQEAQEMARSLLKELI